MTAPAALALLACLTAQPMPAVRSVVFDGADVLVTASGVTEPRVWDGDRELEVLSTRPEGTAPAFVFVLDTSGSSARLLAPVSRAIATFLESWPESRVALVGMGSHPTILLDPTPDHGALGAALAGITPAGRNSITSAVGVALGLAGAAARPVVIVITDGVDTLGPVPPAMVRDAVRCSQATICALGIGNRVDTSTLEDYAVPSGGWAHRVLTPVDVQPELGDLTAELRSETLTRARLAVADPYRQHRISVGDAPSDEGRVACGPWGAQTCEVTVPVLRPPANPEDTMVLVSRGGVPISVGLSNRPVPAPAGVFDVRIAVAPRPETITRDLTPGESLVLEPIELAGARVSGPDLGLSDGTPVSLIVDGEPALELSSGEVGALLPCQAVLRVATTPPFASEPVPLTRGGIAVVSSPDLGELLVDLSGPDGPIDSSYTVRLPGGDSVAIGRSGRPLRLLAGHYVVSVPVPPGREAEVAVPERERAEVNLDDYGALLVRAYGVADTEVRLRLTVRDSDTGRLLASGRTGLAITLASGTYRLELGSTPRLVYDAVTVEPGRLATEEVRRLGGLHVVGPEGAIYRVLQAESGKWIGTFDCGEQVALLAGKYRLNYRDEKDREVARDFTIEPGLVLSLSL